MITSLMLIQYLCPLLHLKKTIIRQLFSQITNQKRTERDTPRKIQMKKKIKLNII